LWEAVRAGRQERALLLHTHLLHLWNAIEAPNLPANVRTAMALRGRPGGQPRSPMPPSSPVQQARIAAVLARAEEALGA
jgi:dihydrodipicolinate synthase/N-acetylneuraminate lyase